MSGSQRPGAADSKSADTKRKRELARDFEDALPDGTRDERPDAWGDREGSGHDDEWLRGEVPPHHG